jgi:hypothetical protein
MATLLRCLNKNETLNKSARLYFTSWTDRYWQIHYRKYIHDSLLYQSKLNVIVRHSCLCRRHLRLQWQNVQKYSYCQWRHQVNQRRSSPREASTTMLTTNLVNFRKSSYYSLPCLVNSNVARVHVAVVDANDSTPVMWPIRIQDCSSSNYLFVFVVIMFDSSHYHLECAHRVIPRSWMNSWKCRQLIVRDRVDLQVNDGQDNDRYSHRTKDDCRFELVFIRQQMNTCRVSLSIMIANEFRSLEKGQ